MSVRPAVAPLLALARHWRRRRDMARIARSGAFDRAWYLRRYPEIAVAKVEPLVHYVHSGFREGRFPNPIFDTAWYRATYLPDDDETNPLCHYLRHGRRRGLWPNRWLDPAWYRARYDLAAAVDPLAHYLAAGRDAPAPGPDIDLDAIVSRHHDLGDDGSPLGFLLNTYRVFGAVSPCTSYYLAGWTSRRSGPEIVVTVVVNDQPVGEVMPKIPRHDVKDALGIEALGFCFLFPTRLAHGDRVGLRDELGQALIGCEQTYRVPALGSTTDMYSNRAAIAATFLEGAGIEVGAFTQPTDLPPGLGITFFDRYSGCRLRETYDEGSCRPLMEPDIVGDAQRLEGVPDAAFDFLIANHVVEHLEDPIAFLKRVGETLTIGGRAMIAVPDMRHYEPDSTRVPTSFAHLVEDHELGVERSRLGHYLEVAAMAGHAGDDARAYAATIPAGTIRVHYHVWDADGFVDFLRAAIAHYRLPLRVLYVSATVHEVTAVVEKC